MSTYHIDVQDESGEKYADASGSLDVISYAGKAAFKDFDGPADSVLSVKLIEITEIGGDEKRTVLTITADAETALTMLKKRIGTERKAQAKLEPAGESASF